MGDGVMATASNPMESLKGIFIKAAVHPLHLMSRWHAAPQKAASGGGCGRSKPTPFVLRTSAVHSRANYISMPK